VVLRCGQENHAGSLFREHANASDTEDACLFCFNDLPVMRSLGLWREEALAENGGHQPVAP
jgi:gentisate 1,2-dioxygenase